MKVILFDIDGTLLKTGGVGYAVFDRIFADFYSVPNVTKGFSAGGKTDDIIIHELFGKIHARAPRADELQKIRGRYLELFPQYYQKADSVQILPRAVETVQALAQRPNVSLGLATGNYKQTAYAKIRKIGLADHFGYGGFGCDSAERESLTAMALTRALERLPTKPSQVYVVGDTHRDIECARHIGAQAIAVATGSNSYADLKSRNPDYLLKDLSEFPFDQV